MDREPFAKVVSFGEGVGEYFRIEIEGIPVYCPNNDSGETADKINASVEARVKEEVEKAVAWAQYQCGCAKCVNPPNVR